MDTDCTYEGNYAHCQRDQDGDSMNLCHLPPPADGAECLPKPRLGFIVPRSCRRLMSHRTRHVAGKCLSAHQKVLQRSGGHRVGSDHGRRLVGMINVILTIASSEWSSTEDTWAPTEVISSSIRADLLGRPNSASRSSGPMYSNKRNPN